MWYEILPSFITITTLLSFSTVFTYFTNKLLLGQPYRRQIETEYDSFRYLRDSTMSKRNFAYDFVGLENLPDEPEPESKMEKETEKNTC